MLLSCLSNLYKIDDVEQVCTPFGVARIHLDVCYTRRHDEVEEDTEGWRTRRQNAYPAA